MDRDKDQSGRLDDEDDSRLVTPPSEGFLSFLDFSFEKSYLPTLIKAAYAVGILAIIASGIAAAVYGYNHGVILEAIIAVLVGAQVLWLLLRIWCERAMTIFRTYERLRDR